MRLEHKTIESLCTKLTSGGTPSRKKPEFYVDGTIPWLKTKELKDCNIYDAEEHITEEALRQSSAKLFPVNTVLMAMYGDGRTITSLGILKIKAATNQACCAFFANPDVCNYQYLFYVLRFHRGALIKRALGGAQRNLSVTKISDFKVIAPPITSQDKIASILSAYDDLIENNLKRIKILEEMAQMIYREWFINFRFPGHEKGKMVDSPLGKIPEGWEVKKLEDVCKKIASGGTPARKNMAFWENGGINWFKTKELMDGFLFEAEEKITEEGLKGSSAKMFPENTVVMAIYAAPTVGRLGVLTKASTFNQAAVGFIVNNDYITNEFLYYKLLEERDNFNSIAQGAAQQNISVQKVKDKNVILPSFDLVHKFTNMISPFRSALMTLSEKNANLRKTRDLFLPKLISGELDVEELDIRGTDNEH